MTFAGQPVPSGSITFLPLVTKGNRGPASAATITDGKFDTAKIESNGISGGMYDVVIAGFDGKKAPGFPKGKPIFNPHKFRVKLPEETTVKTFDVPRSAGEGLVITPEASME